MKSEFKLSFPLHLRNKRSYPDANEDGIGEKSLSHISLAVNLSRVDLVEESHHDEGVENNSEVLRRWGVKLGISATVDIENLLTCKRKIQLGQQQLLTATLTSKNESENDNQLVH